MPPNFTLTPGTLWAHIVAASARAQQLGAIQPIATQRVVVSDQGMNFVVRLLAQESGAAALDSKTISSTNLPQTATPRTNPFLPYDPAMFVADLSPTHLCLLNKYNVIDHHLLIVTRQFEEQEAALTAADCAALVTCLVEFDGLGFYNAGRLAGASQRHKHMQYVASSELDSEPDTMQPVTAALAAAHYVDGIGASALLPFRHAVIEFAPGWLESPAMAARVLHTSYLRLLHHLDLWQADDNPAPYNLLVTRHWMMMASRSCERWESIEVNALGFAGHLLVRSADRLEFLRRIGPLRLLSQVGVTI